LVVILDQLETVLVTGEGDELLAQLLDHRVCPKVAVVLGVREDFVARLLAVPALADGAPQLRLTPLDRRGARDALVDPLREHGVVIEPALLERLLDDLERAAAGVGAGLGWSSHDTIYPPHLQLAGSTLYDALGADETTLTMQHYLGLGGF